MKVITPKIKTFRVGRIEFPIRTMIYLILGVSLILFGSYLGSYMNDFGLSHFASSTFYGLLGGLCVGAALNIYISYRTMKKREREKDA